MSRRSKFWKSLTRTAVGLAATAVFACQSVLPVVRPLEVPKAADAGPAPSAAPVEPAKKVLDPVRRENARFRLATESVSDFAHTLVSAPTRWVNPDKAKQRRLEAFGAAFNANWTGGVALTAVGCAAGDVATNGIATRAFTYKFPARIFLITKNGIFLDLDPVNPTVGYNKTNLGDTFTKTYVSLSGDGAVAFVVSDSGKAYAINVATALAGSPPSHAVKAATLNLPLPGAAVGTALYCDPATSAVDWAYTEMYFADNGGKAHKLVYNPGPYHEVFTAADFTGATFTEPGSGVTISTASPLTGSAKIMAPPVVLDQVMYLGDRAGNVYRYDWSTSTLDKFTTTYGYPIETPIVVDTDDNLNVTDIFAAAGAQLFWIKPSGIVYAGQYALVEKGGNSGTIDATTFSTYLNVSAATTFKASTDYSAFATVQSSTTNSGTIPQAPVALVPWLDYSNFTQCEFMSGLPPTIWAYIGQTGRKFYSLWAWNHPLTGTTAPTLSYTPNGGGTTDCSYPVQDGDSITSAKLLGPTGIDQDTDGSLFIADSQHNQILFKPASSTAWQNWFPAGTMTGQPTTPVAPYYWRTGFMPSDLSAANSLYVVAGTLFPYPPFNDSVGPPYTQTAANWSGADKADATTGANDDNTAAVANKTRDVGNGYAPTGSPMGSVLYTPPVANGVGTALGSIARQTAIDGPRGVAVGKLGLYIADRNGYQSTGPGEILFMPRVGLPAGTYFGISNPQPGKLYVICNNINPQGCSVYKYSGSTMRDVVYAVGYAGTNANKLAECDSASATANILSGWAGSGGTLNAPTDVCVDDDGNLLIADQGNDALKMIWHHLPSQSTKTRRWGVAAPAVNNIYRVGTNTLTEISSVTFSANDPQVPSGCVYLGLGDGSTTSGPNRVLRMDESAAFQSAAGPKLTAYPTIPAYAMADSADSTILTPLAGDDPSVKLALPWRARGDGNGTTYICDRWNCRIRKLVSTAGSSTAVGYLCIPYPAASLGKPVYTATLSLTSSSTPGLPLSCPQIGVVGQYLQDGTTPWKDTTVPAVMTPMQAPSLDLAAASVPSNPAPTAGQWTFTTGSTYQYTLPAPKLVSSATDANLQHLRLGMTYTSDTYNYFYPTSQGLVNNPNVKSPTFYTNRSGTAAQQPSVTYTYGTKALNTILSPPSIVYKNGVDPASGGTRYIFVNNCNCIFRYDTTSLNTFISPTNGATVAFTRSPLGQAANGTLQGAVATGAFMFNSTTPLSDLTGKVWMVDCQSTNAPTNTAFSYNIVQFDGYTGATNMASSSASIGVGLAGTTALNGGLYLSSLAQDNGYYQDLFTGLGNGKIYRFSIF
jgi:hypothetical protein